MFYACEAIQLFSVVLYVVTDAHKFDVRLAISETPEKCRPVGKVQAVILRFLRGSTRVPPTVVGADNPLTPNDHCSGRTAPLTSKRCILYIYLTNIGTEYFKRGIYPPFFPPLQNAVCFIILTYLVPILFTFYIQGVLKLKK